MREILFKAKDNKTREWVEGSLLVLDWESDYVYIVKEFPRASTLPVSVIIADNMVLVNKETLCQYTGMDDKNEKKIWENDIVVCEHKKYPENKRDLEFPFFPEPIKYKRNYKVEFVNTGFNYGYRLRNKSIHFMLNGNVIYNHNVRTVGNIFDNPELLEGMVE